MAEKLSITIALEGGKAIEQQLEGIGAAGKKAFEDIKQSAEKVGGFKNLKPEEVTAGLKQMGVTGEDALNKITEAVKTATRMERLVGVIQGVEKAFSGLATASKLVDVAIGGIAGAALLLAPILLKTMSDAAEAINKVDAAAIKAGLSIEKFDTLKQGFEAAGLSAKQVASGMDAIAAATEKAKLDQVAKDLKTIQERPGTGLGSGEWIRLTEAMAGGGKAAEAARKAIEKLGGTISESATKSLPDLINKLGGDVPQAVTAFVEQLRTMPDGANRSSQAIEALGSSAGVALVQNLRLGLITADQFRTGINTLTRDQADAANRITAEWNILGTSWDRLKTTIGGKLISEGDIQSLQTAFRDINALLTARTWTEWGAAAKQAFIDIFLPIGELAVKLGGFAGTLGGQIWEGWGIAGKAAVDVIVNALDKLWEKLKGIGSAIAGAFGGGGGGGAEAGSIPGNARGGLLGGRGSGTSDSNLAWVSRGEHIMPAAAVRQPGVLALLEALRRSGGNLRGALDGMGRFAAGGVVPRFAEGGLVGGMGHLGTVDLRTDHGSVTLMASGSAMDQLSRLAVTKRMTSTGRKPGFIG